ncbi:hypothetical protein E2C01_079457 [Portunus trituberculatus]|uniref:Uncharacterized protein n=1 Tax=Portunus trituberculatus TaxID=210409 RepID=A0A5B7IJL7_PORTR|nr:hypothetical protein [Portunus trituberculatus]
MGYQTAKGWNILLRPAKQELCGCQELEDSKEGYKEAWDLLETRHGNKRTYIQQLMKGVCGGSSVRMNDTKGLFMDALSTCVRNLKVMGELKQIGKYEFMHLRAGIFKG